MANVQNYRNTVRKQVLEVFKPFQSEIDKILSSPPASLLSASARREKILVTGNDARPVEEWIAKVREQQNKAMSALGKKMRNMFKAGLLHKILEPEDYIALSSDPKANHALETKQKKPLIDLPEALGTGFSIWNFNMNADERWPFHDHKVAVGTVLLNGNIMETECALTNPANPANYELDILRKYKRAPGSVNVLTPGTNADIHAVENITMDAKGRALPACTMHFSAFSQQNGIPHPIRTVFERGDRTPETLDRIGPWACVSETEAGAWVTYATNRTSGPPDFDFPVI